MWLHILFFLSSYKQINVLYLRNSIFFFLHVFLWQVTRVVTANLNKIIDINYYPVETAKRSNLQNRPIGIGVQGLADTFILLGMAFDSPEVLAQICHAYFGHFKVVPLDLVWWLVLQALQLNKDIFETIYYHALKASSELASKDGPYETYYGSPLSKVCVA